MLANRYAQRRVAAADAQACFICYKPTTGVLVNEVPSADFFYVCDAHLKDAGFAKPDQASQDALRLEEQRRKDIAALQEEWEELQKKKSSEKDTKDGDAKAGDGAPLPPKPVDEPPSKPIKIVYELNKGVFNLRLGAKKRLVQERKTKQMLSTPGIFPEVPKHKPQ